MSPITGSHVLTSG